MQILFVDVIKFAKSNEISSPSRTRLSEPVSQQGDPHASLVIQHNASASPVRESHRQPSKAANQRGQQTNKPSNEIKQQHQLGREGLEREAHAWQKSVSWKLTVAKRNESGAAAGETMGNGIVIAY